MGSLEIYDRNTCIQVLSTCINKKVYKYHLHSNQTHGMQTQIRKKKMKKKTRNILFNVNYV
jgi:hypothetical protein